MKVGAKIELSAREQLTVFLFAAMATAPHLLHLAPGISTFFIAIIGLRLLALHFPGLLPGRLLLFLLTIGGLANVLAHYPLLLGRDAGVALLISMQALKLLELRRRRDIYVVVFLGYFILVTQFLFRQEMLLVGYVSVALVGLTAMLVQINRATVSERRLAPYTLALALLLQALPIMLVLFFLFPRFESPLWDLGLEQKGAVTGISDRITPGSISRLSRSRAIAFRVDFERDTMPPPALRYWRGPVLWDTDGKSWVQGKKLPGPPDRLLAASNPIPYSVTLEPTPGSWLFALDIPRQTPPNSRLSADFQLTSAQRISRRTRYQASASLNYRTGPLSVNQRQRALQLPDNITVRMRRLVQDWQQRADSQAAVVEQALQYFRRQPFYYTLYPPLAETNPSDQFLFDTRRGFCEHYATSFTLLMRLAGIPSRVVTGYQGGERNPLGDYLIVRQSDAHAWSEVWLPEQGWKRVDPTAAVAPQRIQQSLDPDLIDDFTGAPIVFRNTDSDLLRSFAHHLNWGLDTINASWHRWILGYSKQRQSRLLQLLGLDFLNGNRLALGMVAITGFTVLLLFAIIAYRSRDRIDPTIAAYRQFCRRLAHRGIGRQPHEGPRDYARRVILSRPELGLKVESIVRLYIGIRYGRMDNPENRRRLQRLVADFRP